MRTGLLLSISVYNLLVLLQQDATRAADDNAMWITPLLFTTVLLSLVATALSFFNLKQKTSMLESRLEAIGRLKQKTSVEKSLAEKAPETVGRERQEEKPSSTIDHQFQRLEQFVHQYRERLCKDQYFSEMKILDMTMELKLLKLYVQLVLHQQKSSFFPSPALQDTEGIGHYLSWYQRSPLGFQDTQESRDPDSILRSSWVDLEHRANSALTPEIAIRLYRRIIVLGDPGAGKTTLLKYLALKTASRQLSGLSDLPIHIDLNAFASSSQQDLLKFAALKWSNSYGFPYEDAHTYMVNRLQSGEALLLLDGLDETLIGTNREKAELSYLNVIQLINQISENYPETFIIVTARIAGYQQRAPLANFTELEILGFRSKDIEQFVNNWFSYRASQKEGDQAHQMMKRAADLNSQLKQNPRIHTLVSTPLLLALVINIYEKKAQDLRQERRADLYARCIELLLAEWNADESRSLRRQRVGGMSLSDVGRLLGKIGWEFHCQGHRYFPESDLSAIIADFLTRKRLTGLPPEKNQQVLDDISVDNGMLKKLTAGWYGFPHLTFQEYFTAVMVDEEENGFETLLQHIGDPWWDEIVLLYAGRTSHPERLQECLIHIPEEAKEEEVLFHTRIILAGRCLAAQPIRGSIWNTTVDQLLKILQHTHYSLIWREVATTLAELGDAELGDDKLDDEKIHAWLLKDALNEERPLELRKSIIRALGLYGREAVVMEMLQFLANMLIHTEIRILIIQVVGRIGIQSVTEKLLQLLTSQSVEIEIRVSIIEILGYLGDRSLSERLEKLLSDLQIEREMKVACALVDTLGLLENHSAVPGRSDEEIVVSNLHKFYNDLRQTSPVRPIHWHVALALAALGEFEVIPTFLLPIIDDEKYAPVIRVEIMNALGALHLRSLAQELHPRLVQEKLCWEVRVSIVIALGATGERSILPYLLTYLADENINSYVRTAIASVIGILGGHRSIRILDNIPIKEKTYPQIYRAICTAKGKLGEKQELPQLLRWLVDNKIDPVERLNMLDAVCVLQSSEVQQSDSRIVSILFALLEDRDVDKELRRHVPAALARLTYESSVLMSMIDSLKKLLQTSDLSDEIHRALWTLLRRITQPSVRLHKK